MKERRKAGKRLGSAIAFAMALAGCSLFVDLDGLSNDAGISPSPDASADTSAPTDAATTDDRAAIVDAGDSGPKAFCPQPGTQFCEDFDEPDAATGLDRWTNVLNGGASPMLSTARFTSGPRALSIVLGSNGSSAVGTTFSGAKVTAAFDLYIEDRGGNLTVVWFEIAGGNDVYFQPYDVATSHILEGYNPGDGGFIYEATGVDPVAIAKFVHVEFTVDFLNAVATATIDGTVIGSRDLAGAAWKNASKGNVYFGCPSTSNTSLYYDNVTVR